MFQSEYKRPESSPIIINNEITNLHIDTKGFIKSKQEIDRIVSYEEVGQDTQDSILTVPLVKAEPWEYN